MNRKLLLLVLAVLAIGVGVLIYAATRNDDDGGIEGTSNTDAAFSAVSTEGLDFVATISSSGSGQGTKSTVSYDGEGRWQYQTSADGQSVQTIVTPDAYYTNSGQGWYKLPLSGESDSSGFNAETYEYSAAEIDALKQSSIYEGQKDCPAGTCHVWRTSTAGDSSTVYIDTKTNRISQVVSVIGSTTSTIAYEYKNVTVNVPADAQPLPGLNQ
ncbi:hypothetical protein HY346_02335 [Candidatus Microgenomates bacterium]|nr:hypothetical protein [Candidatus Microgenomates bacterium]